MKDPELELLTDWRFTKVRANDKVPYPAHWQKNHLPLSEIPQTDNVGVVLGEPSNGLMALDFDGPSSWVWFDKHINCTIPTTVMWASGKADRCQMAFTVPQDYWEFIRTLKITTKTGVKGGVKPEQMEFRWNGAQSVLPPSVHPERADGYNYNWIVAPSSSTVAALPDAIIAWLLAQAMPKHTAQAERVQGDINTIKTSEFEQLEAVLYQIKGFYPVLDYDLWLRVSFATAHEIGDNAAAMLLSRIWPEEQEGEYLAHLRGRDGSRSPTMGTLIHIVKETQGVNARKIVNNNKY